MSNFDIRKFLVENKLTTASRLQEKNTPGFDRFADAVEDIFPVDDPRHDKLLNAVHDALIDGDIYGDPNEPGSYYRQAYALAQKLGLVEEDGNVDEMISPEAEERMLGMVNIEAYNNLIRSSEVVMNNLLDEGFEEDEVVEFIIRMVLAKKYI